GLHPALSPHHDDNDGSVARHAANSAEIWRGRRCAPAARPGCRRRARRLPIPDALYHPGALSLHGTASGLASPPANASPADRALSVPFRNRRLSIPFDKYGDVILDGYPPSATDSHGFHRSTLIFFVRENP